MPKHPVSFRLDPDLVDRLRGEAKARGVTVTALVAEALDDVTTGRSDRTALLGVVLPGGCDMTTVEQKPTAPPGLPR